MSDIEEVEVTTTTRQVETSSPHSAHREPHPASNPAFHTYTEPPVHYTSASQTLQRPKTMEHPPPTSSNRQRREKNATSLDVNYKTIAIGLAVASFVFNIVAIGVKSYVNFGVLDVFRIVVHLLIINGLCFAHFSSSSNTTASTTVLPRWIYFHVCVTEVVIFILTVVLFGIYLAAGIRFSDHSDYFKSAVFYQIDHFRNSAFYFAAAGLTFVDGIIIGFLTTVCFLIFKSY